MRECPRCKVINDDSSKRCDCGLVFDAGVVVPIIRPGSPAEDKAYGPPRAVDVIGRILWALAGLHILWLAMAKEWALPVISGVALSVGLAMAWDGVFRRR